MVAKEPNSIIVPVIEFISDHHATHYIVRQLLSFSATEGKNIQPVRVKVEFSIIHGILLAFNYMAINDYLKLCFRICNGKERERISPLFMFAVLMFSKQCVKLLRIKLKTKN